MTVEAPKVMQSTCGLLSYTLNYIFIVSHRKASCLLPCNELDLYMTTCSRCSKVNITQVCESLAVQDCEDALQEYHAFVSQSEIFVGPKGQLQMHSIAKIFSET